MHRRMRHALSMKIEPEILFTDASFLILEKPAGLPSISASPDDTESLASWILTHFPDQAMIGPPGEAGLVHRLDNDTSGLIVCCRTQTAYDDLRVQFENGAIKKSYLALVVGATEEGGEIDLPIAHHPRKKDRMVVCESPARTKEWKGREAHTRFTLLDRFLLEPDDQSRERIFYSLLEVAITTGVRHQIRVHLAHAGYPLAGDRLYQNTRIRTRDRLPLSRHFLHASRLVLIHPLERKPVAFESALPDDLSGVLETMERRS